MIDSTFEPITALQKLFDDVKSQNCSEEDKSTLETTNNKRLHEKFNAKSICSLTKKIRFKWVY